MPRDGSNIYHRPPGTDAVTDTTIESTKYNTNVADVEQDLNTPRPIVAGGTGASTPAGAMANLGGEFFQQVVDNYNSFVFQPGSFHSLAGATAAPVAGHAFSGTCYQTDASNMFIEATDQDDVKQPGGKWMRQKKAGVWSLWASLSASVIIADTAPTTGVADNSLWWESDTGTLYVRYNDGDSVQWVVASPVPDLSVYVQKSGDTMTGPLVLPGDATLALQAVPKQQLDAVGTVAGGGVRYDIVQALTAAQQVQARQNIYAAPFDALAFNGMQINGSMDVWQELGTTGASGMSGTTKYIADGWLIQTGGAQVMVAIGTSVVPPGFLTALQMYPTTANSAPGGTDYLVFAQKIEGYRVARLGWGTANASPVTIGFWVYSSQAGQHAASLRNGANNRSYIATYTVNVARTWEFKVITIPGDTTGAWAKDNTAGIMLSFAAMSGPTLQTTAGVWTAGAFVSAPGSVNLVATTADLLVITGVIVLPGVEAPSAARSPFIMRPFDQELIICQRHFEKSYDYANPPGAAIVYAGAEEYYVRDLQNTASANVGIPARYKVTKRGAPTILFYSPQTGAIGKARNMWESVDASVTANSVGSNGFFWNANTNTAQTVMQMATHWTADARL